MEQLYNINRIVGITPEGDVFIVDDIPKQVRKKMMGNAGIDINNFGPQAFEAHICNLVWRNLTQREWEMFVPDEPYQSTCTQFDPGFGTTDTQDPSLMD